MNTLQQRAQALFNNPSVSEDIVQHNISQWIAATQYIGEKHMLAGKVERLAVPRKF